MSQRIIETALPSGLFVVTTEDVVEPKPDPQIQGDDYALFRCRYCEATTTVQCCLLMRYKTDEGFKVIDPTCGHGLYVVCPQCYDKLHAKTQEYLGCPQCGCGCEYT